MGYQGFPTLYGQTNPKLLIHGCGSATVSNEQVHVWTALWTVRHAPETAAPTLQNKFLPRLHRIGSDVGAQQNSLNKTLLPLIYVAESISRMICILNHT